MIYPAEFVPFMGARAHQETRRGRRPAVLRCKDISERPSRDGRRGNVSKKGNDGRRWTKWRWAAFLSHYVLNI